MTDGIQPSNLTITMARKLWPKAPIAFKDLAIKSHLEPAKKLGQNYAATITLYLHNHHTTTKI